MKAWMLLAVLFAPGLESGIAPVPRVVYGTDDRLEYDQVSAELQSLADSTAGMVYLKGAKPDERDPGSVLIGGETLEKLGVCKGEPFSEQRRLIACSGFLVGSDLLVTAGHCMKESHSCRDFGWVFDYHSESVLGDPHPSGKISVPRSKIYSCVRVEEMVLDKPDTNDYALVRLDRPVTGREPLKFRTRGTIPDDASLIVIGHPSGGSTKIDGTAGENLIRENDPARPSFIADMDTFEGSSGSPVFNSSTLKVEGLLVRGTVDYLYDRYLGCLKVFRCPAYDPQKDSGFFCSGEAVSRIANIKGVMPGGRFSTATPSPAGR